MTSDRNIEIKVGVLLADDGWESCNTYEVVYVDPTKRFASILCKDPARLAVLNLLDGFYVGNVYSEIERPTRKVYLGYYKDGQVTCRGYSIGQLWDNKWNKTQIDKVYKIEFYKSKPPVITEVPKDEWDK